MCWGKTADRDKIFLPFFRMGTDDDDEDGVGGGSCDTGGGGSPTL
jgi:hypothetical protein